jgi:hypothetical protein
MRNKQTFILGSIALAFIGTALTVAVRSAQNRNRDNPRQEYLSTTAAMQQMFRKQFGDYLHRIEATPH